MNVLAMQDTQDLPAQLIILRARAIPKAKPLLSELLESLLKIGGGVGAGALGLEALKRWLDSRQKRRGQEVEVTAQIIDDGGDMRRELLAETHRLRAERVVSLERAHQAEMRAVKAEGLLAAEVEKSSRLVIKLERRDAQCVSLFNQLLANGKHPVVSPADLPPVDSPAGGELGP